MFLSNSEDKYTSNLSHYERCHVEVSVERLTDYMLVSGRTAGPTP